MHGIDARRGVLPSRRQSLAGLRLALARIGDRNAAGAGRERAGRFLLGAPGLDVCLEGGLNRAGLHEIQASQGVDWPATAGFGLALALRAAPGRPVLWARQEVLDSEAGRLNGVGLAEFGLDPAAFSLVRGRDAEAVLRAGVEAARCKSLGAVVIEIFGAPRALDLTATLRLARAAEVSGVTVFLLRIRPGEAQEGAGPPPSAAVSRWRARAQASCALLANAPGGPSFSVTLLRHRGAADRASNLSWRLEWLRDQARFHEIAETETASLSGPVPAVSADGTPRPPWRRAG